MATSSISFWARADSITANNSVLNPIGTSGANGVPAFQLHFTNDDPDLAGVDENGDLVLETNGGLPDPDTSVVINGVSYPFTLVLTGTLPTGNSNTPDQYEGKAVALIRVVINGTAREYFFLLDGSGTQAGMNAFGNGAIALTLIPTPQPPVAVCFCAGTLILTPAGYRPVETLCAGDMVVNDEGAARPLAWVGCSRFDAAALAATPALRPVRIPAHAFGPGLPAADLHVSPQHRIVVEGPEAELMFGAARVLVPARHLAGTLAEIALPEDGVAYYHLLCEAHEILISNGLPSESFQPARRNLAALSGAARARLDAVIAALGEDAMLSRRDALPGLKRHEAEALAFAVARRGDARRRATAAADEARPAAV